jgi:uncharacterized membrane protein (UPF0127 family)
MTPDFRTRLRLSSLAFFTTLLWVYPGWSAQPSRLLVNFDHSRAVIETSNALCLVIDIYLADTREQQAQGLMYIEKMDAQEGMLFRHSRSAQIAMWMKNTYIPLDMFFIGEDGSIVNIVKKTTPLSTQRISSSGPVVAVLEMNAGFSDRWNITAGNRILAVN